MFKTAKSKPDSTEQSNQIAGTLRRGPIEPYNNPHISKETEFRLFQISEEMKIINNSWTGRTLDRMFGFIGLSHRKKVAKEFKEMMEDVNVALYVVQDDVLSRTKLSPKGLTAAHFAVTNNPIIAHVALEEKRTASISDKRGWSVAHSIAYHYTEQSFSQDIIKKILMIKSLWEISTKKGDSVKDVIESSEKGAKMVPNYTNPVLVPV